MKKQSRFKALFIAASLLIPIVLIGLLVFKKDKPIPIVFTSVPPPPRIVPYAPEKKLSALQIMDLHSVDTNRADIAGFMAKVAESETELSVLESSIYSTNLALWTYKQYDGVVDKWYHAKPLQRDAWYKYEYPAGVVDAKRQKVCGEIDQLLNLVAMEELSRDADFGALIRGAWEPALKLLKTSGGDQLVKFRTGFFGGDQLAGYWQLRNEPIETWDDLRSAVHRRYPSYVAAIQERVRTENVPANVFSDMKDYALIQTIDFDTKELFIPLHTPEELTKMRDKLDKAITDLSWARSTNQAVKRD